MDTICSISTNTTAYDVGRVAHAHLDRVGFQPVIGEQKTDASRIRNRDTSIERGGKTWAPLLMNFQIRISLQLVENPQVRVTRLRRCDDEDLAGDTLIECGFNGMLQPIVGLVQQRDDDGRGEFSRNGTGLLE